MYQINYFIVALWLCCQIAAGCRKPDTSPESGNSPFARCVRSNTGKNSMDIVTWNVHDFPNLGEETIQRFAEWILAIDADILALQEIKNAGEFNKLLGRLPGYTGLIDARANQNLAFLYKNDEFIEQASVETLFENDVYSFPRPPLLVSVMRRSGDPLIFIDIHLKCCEGIENETRRRSGLEKLKKYIDVNLPSSPVILLGDFNDEITRVPAFNVFNTFLSDSLHFRFTDLLVARGDSRSWSYPSWPSHIDHFIITDELFPEDYSCTCLKPDACDSSYFTLISDHRPMLLQFYYP